MDYELSTVKKRSNRVRFLAVIDVVMPWLLVV
jgi:hypothetical protein